MSEAGCDCGSFIARFQDCAMFGKKPLPRPDYENSYLTEALVAALIDAADVVEYVEGPERIEGTPEDFAAAVESVLTARLAAVEALVSDEVCWVTRSNDVSCTSYVGGRFENGAEYAAEMCCLPCRVRDALTSGTRMTWFREEYERAKAHNAQIPQHARMTVTNPVLSAHTRSTTHRKETVMPESKPDDALPYVTTEDGVMWSAEAVEQLRQTELSLRKSFSRVQLELDLLRGQIHFLDAAQRPGHSIVPLRMDDDYGKTGAKS